jgi:hypothetical protein
MIGRLLQVLYTGDYGTAQHEASLFILLRNSLADDAPLLLADTQIDNTPYLVSHHFTM